VRRPFLFKYTGRLNLHEFGGASSNRAEAEPVEAGQITALIGLKLIEKIIDAID
jgi:hypothetical protein